MHDTDQTIGRSKRPAEWQKEQMKPDRGGTKSATIEPRSPDREHWNKGQMGGEHPDHTRAPLAREDELAESGGALSGGGSNPGGGERWADRDKR